MRDCIDTNVEIRVREWFAFRIWQGTPRTGISHLGRKAVRLIMVMLQQIEAWRARGAQRRRLRTLDDRLLKDFGVSRYDAEMESRKPFWRP